MFSSPGAPKRIWFRPTGLVLSRSVFGPSRPIGSTTRLSREHWLTDPFGLVSTTTTPLPPRSHRPLIHLSPGSFFAVLDGQCFHSPRVAGLMGRLSSLNRQTCWSRRLGLPFRLDSCSSATRRQLLFLAEISSFARSPELDVPSTLRLTHCWDVTLVLRFP